MAETNRTSKGVTISEGTADLFRQILGQIQLSPASPNFEADAAALTEARRELGLI